MLIFWDGSGVCRVAKRLEDGEFHWPRVQDGAMHLTAASSQCCSRDWTECVTVPSDNLARPIEGHDRPAPMDLVFHSLGNVLCI
ncbi:transposase [Rhizobium laguerreae]|nr:transposase [Rhizobium laguerreae]